MTQSIARKAAFTWLVGGLLLMPALLPAATTNVDPTDQVQFQQQTIAAQMQELQDRMFRLSETTRTLEPDDSAKLVLAVQRARESLILEQMKDAIDLLGQRDLGKASEDQRQLLAKLEALKQLLLSGDLDLQAQLQRLRDIDAALKKIDAIAQQEKLNRSQTAQLAGKPAATQPAALKQQETAAMGQTQDVQRNVQTFLSNPGAAAALGNAAGKMNTASNQLGSNKPGDALPAQDGALNDLADARKALLDQKEKLLTELERTVRKQVIANLQEMLERQQRVRETIKPLATAVAAGDREALLSVRRTATAEQRIVTINDETLELLKETDFSIALPPALQEIGRRCVFLQNDLDSGKAGEPVEAQSLSIEQDLAALIDTFKQLAGAPSNSQCRGCKGNKNKLLAELKVLRLLQVRVNHETVDVDQQRAAVSALPPALKQKVESAYGHQNDAQAVADRIAKALAPDAPVN